MASAPLGPTADRLQEAMTKLDYAAYKPHAEEGGQPLAPALEPAPPPRQLLPDVGPKAVDTLLAGIGLWVGCAALGVVETWTGARVFAPPMLASGIIFFAGPHPPDPTNFLSGSLCSATLCLAALALLSLTPLPPAAAQGAAAATLLMWYKSFGHMFPPAAVLAGSLLGCTSLLSTATYLAIPWLTGHAWLYGCAWAMSVVRSRARVAMTQRRLASLHTHTDAQLRTIFRTFDTSGDHALDAAELKVALRVAVGVDLPLSDCEQLVALADTDGTGMVEFDEFRAICRQQL